ncbi:bactofilin family protein [Fervidibacillus halotolerans]|uniref:Polymer-forming cytoskeletal protein n=1 Tax=Fervidibacillus halotolerans TaxID=2980027 RepID=A0A9E8LZ57_9BACI|nr:polymer-forming cytoskeletal protein [Fervidibacillus halotolerans]WAA12259.1 polymer-forming cytoskeletal protein [Fervidibacillus halotolerans]
MIKKRDERSIETIISKETVIEGKITLPSSLRIDGKILGEIESSGDVYIGKGAHVEPTVRAKNIIVAGEVKGDVHATEKIRIEATGKLNGTISARGIIIEDGGIFNGSSTIVEAEETVGLKSKNKLVNKKETNEAAG